MQELTVYSRQGCGLCEQMLEALDDFKVELGYTYIVYDIDGDQSLFDQYNTLVPLVLLGNQELMRYHFALAPLKAILQGEE